MPNIILTEYCNLKCPYCFANQMIDESNENNKNITIEQLQFILKWLTPTASKKDFQVGLIGGEPTLHPNFKEILLIMNNFCSLTKSNAIIFTNGLTLNNFLHLINHSTSILVNVNKLNELLNQKLIYNLNLVNDLKFFENQQVTLGCNLYLEEKNYDYFWNIVDLFPDIKIVRMSVTAPNNISLKQNKELYYTSMKKVFLDFINNAKKRNIKISYDCNQIPLCFFNEKEQKLILSLSSTSKKEDQFCDPVIDITPDFKATCCFGVYNQVDCFNFEDLEQLERYFKAEMTLKIKKNNNCMCENCEKIQLMKCQGGCLSFSNE